LPYIIVYYLYRLTSAEFIFGVKGGSVDERARAFLTELEKFIKSIGQPLKVSDWPGVTIQKDDIDVMTKIIMGITGKPMGYQECATEEVIRQVLAKVVK
jgi:alcohol dehydrogenase YqhD (iron-dependent ADH family)